ncbi:hypothetical protein W02_00880 [Nitrospira sp. KM1]|uniref:hypothetical protein n=1 Tax=Nitrospira sp. KM1 TaxID=1936990 RepID=UPI0013A72935|nr:hypothetical protein [Nitrospira sp. KM1]BCA52948.1 hypothetical protein W02_00880 [Nitrospira sp. KM1]
MTPLHPSLSAFVLAGLILAACDRQGPPPKPIGSATNKHVEEAPAAPSRRDVETLIEKMNTPMDDARQAENMLKESADRTKRQAEHANP